MGAIQSMSRSNLKNEILEKLGKKNSLMNKLLLATMLSEQELLTDKDDMTLQSIVQHGRDNGWSLGDKVHPLIAKIEGWQYRRLAAAAEPSTLSGSSSILLFSMIPLLFLVYWFFSRRFQAPVKRSRKQSTYRCHYPENAEDFSEVEPEIDMV